MTKQIFGASLALLLTACASTSVAPANPTLETIHARRSVRKFTPRTVSADTIDLMLRAAMAAPSGMDLRPWHFVVVNDRTAMDSLQVQLPYAGMLATAPHAVAICGDTTVSPYMWQTDCALAGENLLLAAQSLGIATVWTGVHPGPDRIAAVRKALNLPDNIVPLTLIPFGYEDGESQPKEKYDSTRIHWNQW